MRDLRVISKFRPRFRITSAVGSWTELKSNYVQPADFFFADVISIFRFLLSSSVCTHSDPSTPTPTKSIKMSGQNAPPASPSYPPGMQVQFPPRIPLFSSCFPRGSVDLGKYMLYSDALRRRARSRALLLFGNGARGESYDSGDDFVPPWRHRREAAARKHRSVLARIIGVGYCIPRRAVRVDGTT